MKKKKDYCTWFPENWFGTYIGDCCKIHDEDCSTRKFFVCLRDKIGHSAASLVTTGGALGCWAKYFNKMWNRI